MEDVILPFLGGRGTGCTYNMLVSVPQDDVISTKKNLYENIKTQNSMEPLDINLEELLSYRRVECVRVFMPSRCGESGDVFFT